MASFKTTPFKTIRARAEKRKGGPKSLLALLPPNPDPKALARLGDDRVLAEMTRRVFCAGFAWKVVDAKWAGFEAAFHQFDPGLLLFQPEDYWDGLLKDAGIVRNRGKIEATIGNARATVSLLEAGKSLDDLCWSFRPAPRPHRLGEADEFPATSPESVALSKELKRRGFRFVGPTTMYAFMQSSGMIDDHMDGCWVPS